MTFFKTLLVKIDSFFCTYFGLSKKESHPDSVKLIGNQMIITYIQSYTRHVHQEKWNGYCNSNLKEDDLLEKEKIGVATGKAIAKNLLITFDDIVIEKESK